MNFGFSEEQDHLRGEVRRFLDERCPLVEVRKLAASEAGYSEKRWRELGSLISRASAAPSASTSPTGTSRPSTPSRTISLGPDSQRVETTAQRSPVVRAARDQQACALKANALRSPCDNGGLALKITYVPLSSGSRFSKKALKLGLAGSSGDAKGETYSCCAAVTLVGTPVLCTE